MVRTEPCSLALRAQIMAATGHAGADWALEGWSPSHEQGHPQVQDALYGTMTWGSPPLPLEPRLPYPLLSSIWPNPPSQPHPEAVPARVRAIEGLLSHPSTRTQSPVQRPSRPRPRPQSLQMPYSPFLRSPPPPPPSVTHSTLSTVTPPPSAVSTSSTPPRPSLPSRSMSWVQYSTAPISDQAFPAGTASPEPPTHLLQAQNQQGYFMHHYPDPNRTSDTTKPPSYHSSMSPEYRQQLRTAYTEEPMYHQLAFDSGRLHYPPPREGQLMNVYPSPTSSASFPSVTPPTNTNQYPSSSTADHEAGQPGDMPPTGK